MVMNDYVKFELDFYREECNFTDIESEIFEMRRQGMSLDRIADLKHKQGYTIDGIKKKSRVINEKIKRVNEHYGIE